MGKTNRNIFSISLHIFSLSLFLPLSRSLSEKLLLIENQIDQKQKIISNFDQKQTKIAGKKFQTTAKRLTFRIKKSHRINYLNGT